VADLRAAEKLGEALLRQLYRRMGRDSVMREMQIAAILADMEAVGIGESPRRYRGSESLRVALDDVFKQRYL
jgi:hypothetical protein